MFGDKFYSSPSILEQLTLSQDVLFNYFTIRIIDDGEGISQEGLKKLFIDFSQLKEHQNSSYRGTGLGLSICKKIIHKMGGKISVKSKPGKGTTFKISIVTLCKVEGKDMSESRRYESSIH